MGNESTTRTVAALTLIAACAVACRRDASANQTESQAPASAEQQIAVPPPGGEAAASPTGKSRFDEAAFGLSIAPRGKVTKGQAGEAVITLVAKNPFHVNQEYPHRFKVTSLRGITTTSRIIQRDPSKVTASQLEMVVPVNLAAGGPFGLDGELSFSVCTDQKCLMEKRPLTVELDPK